MDIVYLVKDCDVCDELTLSLRSLKNLPHDKVFLVGGMPRNINKEKVIHLQTIQSYTKYKNTTLGLEAVCKDDRLSEDFILMNDDFFIMRPIKDPVKELNLDRGLISDVMQEYQFTYPENEEYLMGMYETFKILKDMGIEEPLSYELHIPMVMNKYKVLRMLELPGVRMVECLHKRSLYGNMFMKDSVYTADVKMHLRMKEMPDNKNFLSTSDGYFARMSYILGAMFNEKSEYEL